MDMKNMKTIAAKTIGTDELAAKAAAGCRNGHGQTFEQYAAMQAAAEASHPMGPHASSDRVRLVPLDD